MSIQSNTATIDDYSHLTDDLHKSSENPQRLLLQIPDLIKLFSVSRQTIYNWRRSGQLPDIKLGNKVYFNSSKILKLIDGTSVGGNHAR